MSFKNLAFLGFPNYAINRDGVVLNIITQKELKPTSHREVRDNLQYPSVHLYKGDGSRKICYIHILLANCFIPNPENKPCVNHIDGNKSNFNLRNLEWCTYSENTIHAYRSGLHGWNVITEEMAHMICQCIMKEMRHKDIADMFGVKPHIVTDIFRKVSWKDVSDHYDFHKITRRKKTSMDKVVRICELLQESGGLKQREIAEKVGVNLQLVKSIKQRKRHTNISDKYLW